MLIWLLSRHLNLVSGGSFKASEDVFGGQLFSGAEIAEKLQCSEAAARQRLFRALANLSEALENESGAAR